MVQKLEGKGVKTVIITDEYTEERRQPVFADASPRTVVTGGNANSIVLPKMDKVIGTPISLTSSQAVSTDPERRRFHYRGNPSNYRRNERAGAQDECNRLLSQSRIINKQIKKNKGEKDVIFKDTDKIIVSMIMTASGSRNRRMYCDNTQR